MKQANRAPLLGLLLAGVLFFVLASSLNGLQLAAGQPFSLVEEQPAFISGSSQGLGGDWFIWLFRGMLALAILTLPLFIIQALFTPEGRQRLLADILVILTFWGLSEWLRNLPRALPQTPAEVAAGGLEPLEELAKQGPVATFSAAPPDWLVMAISLLLALFVVAGGFLIYRLVQARQKQASALERLAGHAQQALDDLHSGETLQATIQRCYREMSWVVQEERGLEREKAMTPHEFEHTLITGGLPAGPVHTLTTLFESVRYGQQAAGAAEETMAVESLTAIVRACLGSAEAES